MHPAIAIVGMACRYPDARSPEELWENVLARRRAFRRMPPERLRLEDYYSPDPNVPDRTYATHAAVIEGYEFDRVRFRVVGSTFRSADLAHWLALDMATAALEDAGFAEGEGLPRESTGVVLGNTLTGEFSRAGVMRLRWPYVRRVVEAALTAEGWAPEQRRAFLKDLEKSYKRPFPPVGEESLAGGLSNTIAGRICNQFDFKGGGYTVDGACSASLLAVINACASLVTGDLDVALAGGVDLSLDPFELVGFAKTGALAPEKMRIYDRRSAGFWPGEGCGMMVLMRQEDAVAQDRRIYATIRGWGISSDGSGGITRPEEDGQVLALERAYRRAGFGIDTAAYFEGHGTGTEVGDATELRALSRARRAAATDSPVAALGSIKANIGHTKAAAGIAGLIKATMVVHKQVLPPTTGCDTPHEELTGDAPALRVLERGEHWPEGRSLRAGVSAMGFGGINTHVVVEGTARRRRKTFDTKTLAVIRSAQDAELFLLEAPDAAGMKEAVRRLLVVAPRISEGEMADLAAALKPHDQGCAMRAAVVASSPAGLTKALELLATWLSEDRGPTDGAHLDTRLGCFLGRVEPDAEPRIGFLFPGQGSPAHLSGGAMRRRFEIVDTLYAEAAFPTDADGVATEVAHPAIITASIAALRVLEMLGVSATIAIGHSLGELAALHWGGAYDGGALLRIARARGNAMADLGDPTGSMAGLRAGQEEVEQLLDGQPVRIAGLNTPSQTVVSGESQAVDAVVSRAKAKGIGAVRLPVSHAFHSPLVEAATPELRRHLERETFEPLQRTVASTITGDFLEADTDVPGLLCRQIMSPVRFMDAARSAAEELDLFIEVGPGEVVSGLAGEFLKTAVLPTDAGGPSLGGLLRATGAAFVLGAPIRREALFDGRLTRPFDVDRRPVFFVNPCERAPVSETGWQFDVDETIEDEAAEGGTGAASLTPGAPPLEVVRQLVADRTELPIGAVKNENRLLGDLHLNSIAVGQLVAESARRLGLPPPVTPTDYADATVEGIARALEELSRTGRSDSRSEGGRTPAGVDAWIRSFTVELTDLPMPRRKPAVAVAADGWEVMASPGHPLEGAIRNALNRAGTGGGVVVCLAPEPDEDQIGLLLASSRAVMAEGATPRFVLVQHGGGGASFARTLHLERPDIACCVVDVPVDHPDAAAWVVAEAMIDKGYAEVHYDAAGRARVPRLRLLTDARDGEAAGDATAAHLCPDDVMLVTGGGKGIAAECALAIAQASGARLALLGRSRPEADDELRNNLERMRTAGVEYRYLSADVTDAAQVRDAVRAAEADLGPVTGVLHGAGNNVPQLLTSLDEAAFRDTLRPKVDGARNVLAAIDASRLRLLVAFSSIIARTGMEGEAHYAVANEWLGRLVDRWHSEHPHCRCLSLEWSVWSGAGMGERLGRIDALARRGVTPIPIEEGIRQMHQVLDRPTTSTHVVISGRFGEPPTLKMDEPGLPLLRFVERPRVHYPGVELILDADLSSRTDPYLEDHLFGGERLFPAVMGLEAMAQAAMALAGSECPPVFENVTFNRPVVVREGRAETIRLAAMVRSPEKVDVVLRSKETGFQVDHFAATCVFGAPNGRGDACEEPSSKPVGDGPDLELDPDRDLYGGVLFQSGRFRRLRGYHRLMATECSAVIGPGEGTTWFDRFLPPKLVLGDPGARDAAIHAIQPCIPHAKILPVGVDRLQPMLSETSGPRVVRARERLREGDTFIYNVEVFRSDGTVCERWEGLHLRAVEGTRSKAFWIEPLLGPYMERHINELNPGADVRVFVERCTSAQRRGRSDRAIRQVLGSSSAVRRRPDGKPDPAPDGRGVSASHTEDLTFAVAGPGQVGCDIEPVAPRSAETWRDLLGLERYALAHMVMKEASEDADTAATRIWAACECLKKAGVSHDAPLVLSSVGTDGWVVLTSGSHMTATYVAPVRGRQERLALAVLTRSSRASL